MTTQQEQWREVQGYNGRYQVSDMGNVRSAWFGKLIKPQGQNSGYQMVSLTYKRKHKNMLVHRLVANAFLPLIEGKHVVNHLNGDKSDNRLNNIEWCSQSENVLHAFKTGRKKAHGLPARWRYSPVRAIQSGLSLSYESVTSASRALRVGRSAISNVLTGRARTAGGYTFEYAN